MRLPFVRFCSACGYKIVSTSRGLETTEISLKGYYCHCYRSLSLPQGAVGWYVVCGYDIPGHTHFLIVLESQSG